MAEGVTNQGEDKKLGDAFNGELLVSVANREEPPANPGNTHAEGAGRRRGQGRNIVGDGSLVEMEIALVAGRDDGLHVSIGRQRPGRYSFGLRMIAGEGIVVHVHPLAGECWPTSTRQPGSAGPMVSGRPSANKSETTIGIQLYQQLDPRRTEFRRAEFTEFRGANPP